MKDAENRLLGRRLNRTSRASRKGDLPAIFGDLLFAAAGTGEDVI
jgi:hypothetical protein